MILLSGPISPYVRVVRMQIALCGLTDQIEVRYIPTRVPDSPVHEHNPTGKIPTLVLDNGIALGEVRLICEYLDSRHDGAPFAAVERSLDERAFEGFSVGFMDGMAVFIREARRAEGEQSPSIIVGEEARAHRCLAYLEANPERLGPPTNYVMCCILVSMWRLRYSIPSFEWLAAYPAVAKWYAAACEAPHFVATSPAQ